MVKIDFAVELTDAGIMVLHIQKAAATSALVTAPCVLAFAIVALAGFLLFTFINICMSKGKIRLGIE